MTLPGIRLPPYCRHPQVWEAAGRQHLMHARTHLVDGAIGGAPHDRSRGHPHRQHAINEVPSKEGRNMVLCAEV